MAKIKAPSYPDTKSTNLNTERGQDKLHTADAKFYDQCAYHACLHRFLETGKSPINYDGKPLVVLTDRRDDYLMILVDGAFYELCRLDNLKPDSIDMGTVKDCAPLAMMLPKGTTSKGLRSILIDADEENDIGVIALMSDYDMPAVSFRCLFRFYDADVTSAIVSGKIKVMDYTRDETRKLTSTQQKTVTKVQKDNRQAGLRHQELVRKILSKLRPQRGFTLINSYEKASGMRWHRAGSVLFWDSAEKMCLLLGRDEDTYFGCELPKKVTSLKEAYTVLTPEAARTPSGGIKSDVQRQGEWFMVPVAYKDIPAKSECLGMFDTGTSDTGSFILPVEDDDSNEHSLTTYDGRIAKDGTIYAQNPSLDHDQHASIHSKSWCAFHCNTALRSVSEEGVD